MSDRELSSKIAAPSRANPAYVRAVLGALAVSVLWSTSAVIFKGIVEASAWQTIFYRSVSLTVGMSIFLMLRYRGQVLRAVWSIGGSGLAAAGCLCTATFCFITAVSLTTVANVTFMLGATPFFAALLGFLFLRERLTRATWVAMMVAVAGVLTMVYEGIAGGSLLGNTLALATAVASAGFAVSLRSGRRVDQMPAILISGLIAIVVSGLLADGFAVPWSDVGLCAMQGLLVSAVCNSVFSLCARSVPAAELVLFSLLEVGLAPVWAYLIFSEVPAMLTLAGGGMLMLSVCVHAFYSIRAARSG